MRSRRNGPGVIVLSIGSLVLLCGLLGLLFVPAARRMDQKEAEQAGRPARDVRQSAALKTALSISSFGLASVLVGWALVRKSR